MKSAALIFPHQLFSDHPVLREKPEKVLLVEDPLFFGDARYPLSIHRQRLAFHRVTMASYEKRLLSKGFDVTRQRYQGTTTSLPDIVRQLKADRIEQIYIAEAHDYLLTNRLVRETQHAGIQLTILDTPAFINQKEENTEWRSTRNRWHMADFYQWQRRRLDILMEDGKPSGGQWSYDKENRKRIPAKNIPYLPTLPTIRQSADIKSGLSDVSVQFVDNPGSTDRLLYPSTHASADRWLSRFLEERFDSFGTYEDAMVSGESWLYHSVLTPMLNVGLLTPQRVIEQALDAAEAYKVPLNNVEGFVRQIIGWREFVRATYDDLGVSMRTTNHWGHTNPLPTGFYTAQTGIDPIDDVIKRILNTGYCHHIERLMLLGGFLFICEVDPDEIYRWFMEMFVDAYDWVMVPNVYAMSQHADGGNITTKPYFSGSNYILKMSNFSKGDWSDVWDALFWRWILINRTKLKNNYRWAMVCKRTDSMDKDKREQVMTTANEFLAKAFTQALHH